MQHLINLFFVFNEVIPCFVLWVDTARDER